jgi:asparagine synthase (glutamine-hydrolysing)
MEMIIDEAVKDAVSKHMVSDGEVAVFLSSGVDSSYAAACSGAEKAFTVGFDDARYNEAENAKALAESLQLNHHIKIIDTDEYWNHLPRVQYYMDEPLADPAAAALYFVSREASNHVSAALSGEGADELFGGYNIYREPQSLGVYTWLPIWLRRWLAGLAEKLPFDIKGKNFIIRGGKTFEERFIGNANIFSAEERDNLLKYKAPHPKDITRPYYAQVKHEDDITKMQFLDINLWMAGDILLKADKLSMAHSLQLRTPFLDREVFRTASRIPTRHRVNKKGITKYAFRLAAKRHLPIDVSERKKLGFPVPIRVWLREEKYAEIVARYFNSETAKKYFNQDILLNLLRAHTAGKKDNSRKIWTVYMFLLWHENFF